MWSPEKIVKKVFRNFIPRRIPQEEQEVTLLDLIIHYNGKREHLQIEGTSSFKQLKELALATEGKNLEHWGFRGRRGERISEHLQIGLYLQRYRELVADEQILYLLPQFEGDTYDFFELSSLEEHILAYLLPPEPLSPEVMTDLSDRLKVLPSVIESSYHFLQQMLGLK